MMRAAIYARFSSQLQRDASIDDQMRLCQERIVSCRADTCRPEMAIAVKDAIAPVIHKAAARGR